MTSLPTAWEISSLICKLFLYFGAASMIGGSICLWLFSDGRRQSALINLSYILLGSFCGFQAVLVNFLIQVGLINDRGFSGMFDWAMASILFDTALGDVTVLRMASFVIAMIAGLLFLRPVMVSSKPLSQGFIQRVVLVNTVLFLLLASSFRLAGHISTLPILSQIAIMLHVTAVALWIGSLYPLLILTRSTEVDVQPPRAPSPWPA